MNVQNKYGGNFSNEELIIYFEKLTGKIYKILAMRDENDSNLDKYLESLLLELCGGDRLIIDSNLFMEIIFKLEALIDTSYNQELYRRTVLRCCNKCNELIDKLKS